MQTPRLFLTLTLLIFLALSVSCAAAPLSAQEVAQPAANQPAATASPQTVAGEATATPAPAAATSKPKKTRNPQQTPGAQGKKGPQGTPGANQGSNQGSQGSQSPQAFPTSSYQPATLAFNLILGRPTTNSIAASLLSKSDLQVSIAYGTQPGNYSQQSAPVTLKANVPQTIELTNLSADTEYYYSVNGAEHSFHTARAPGAAFTFTLDADPHNRDPRFDGAIYAATLSNALADHPDFHINLGDTFMTEKVQADTYAAAESTFTDMRPYFGLLAADAPLFLVNGNHEGELGWILDGSDQNLAVWSARLRAMYYPGPAAGGFFSGAASTDAALDSPRDGYYAFTWGDALFIVLDPFWYTTPKPSPSDPDNNWNWTLGREQYDWLKSSLETSGASYKFVFIHNLVGGSNTDARGGIEAVSGFEWGGNNADGSYGFDAQRPGWGKPIHQLFVENHVSAVFHGHDHVFVKQELDGIVYQECPQPSNAQADNTNLASEYGYVHGDVVAGSGHLRITVAPDGATVEFIRASLSAAQNAQVAYRYSLSPGK